MNDTLTALSDLLRELPGIGPRQARRLAFWLVRRETGWIVRFARAIVEAQKTIRHCTSCMRMFPHKEGADTCSLCTDPRRDNDTLLIVEKDVDLENIERTGAYRGRYFVLGGTTSPLDKEPERSIYVQELVRRLTDADESLKEVVLALSATTEGEDTALYLVERIEPILKERATRLSRLGRGLSTGTELEYVDADTMKNALVGRS